MNPRRILLYSVELQIMGIIILTVMAAGGISLWMKRRKEANQNSEENLI
ncbi:MAG: hypothetical protein ACW9WZ_03520 [Nitrosopumilus sp.]